MIKYRNTFVHVAYTQILPPHTLQKLLRGGIQAPVGVMAKCPNTFVHIEMTENHNNHVISPLEKHHSSGEFNWRYTWVNKTQNYKSAEHLYSRGNHILNELTNWPVMTTGKSLASLSKSMRDLLFEMKEPHFNHI